MSVRYVQDWSASETDSLGRALWIGEFKYHYLQSVRGTGAE